jgi:hypothetical protein
MDAGSIGSTVVSVGAAVAVAVAVAARVGVAWGALVASGTTAVGSTVGVGSSRRQAISKRGSAIASIKSERKGCLRMAVLYSPSLMDNGVASMPPPISF